MSEATRTALHAELDAIKAKRLGQLHTPAQPPPQPRASGAAGARRAVDPQRMAEARAEIHARRLARQAEAPAQPEAAPATQVEPEPAQDAGPPPLVAHPGQGHGGPPGPLPLVRQVNPPDHQADPAAGEPAQIGVAVDALLTAAAGSEAAG